MSDEKMLETWPEIAKVFSVSPRTMMRRKKELKADGIIFYRKRKAGEKRVVCAFPSILRLWIQRKGMDGENF